MEWVAGVLWVLCWILCFLVVFFGSLFWLFYAAKIVTFGVLQSIRYFEKENVNE